MRLVAIIPPRKRSGDLERPVQNSKLCTGALVNESTGDEDTRAISAEERATILRCYGKMKILVFTKEEEIF